MNGTYDTKVSIRVKVAFLGLFVLALASARVMVALRSTIILSAPIELSHAGFAVRMPDGNGWQSPDQWDYRQRAFTLYGTFTPNSPRPLASARCTCVFPAEIIDPQQRFTNLEEKLDGHIIKSGQIETEIAVVDWACIQKNDSWSGTMFGMADLPYNRRIEIEVEEGAGDMDMAEQVFRAITESLVITESPLLEAGSSVISDMKAKGVASFMDNQNRQDLFLIRDSRRRIIGFTTSVLVDMGKGVDGFTIQAAGLDYIRGRPAHEEVTSFESDDRFDRFAWKSEAIGIELSGTTLTLEDDGILAVDRSGFSAEVELSQENRYKTGQTVMPDILLDLLIVRMIELNTEEIIVDVIKADGRIIPTRISRVEFDKAAGLSDVSYMLKLTPLDGRDSFQHVYLDDRKRVLRTGLKRESIFWFERGNPKDVAELFPERKEFILQSGKIERYRGNHI
ncbi:MAG: hypothetical protein JW720_10990 [Sedimentisphaerales bacterium]|nr:hypothetical protein [Sedimentisphaerales bacterium]